MAYIPKCTKCQYYRQPEHIEAQGEYSYMLGKFVGTPASAIFENYHRCELEKKKLGDRRKRRYKSSPKWCPLKGDKKHGKDKD